MVATEKFKDLINKEQWQLVDTPGKESAGHVRKSVLASADLAIFVVDRRDDSTLKMELLKIFKEAEHIKARVLLVHKDDTDAKWSTLCAANKIAVEKDEDAGFNDKLTDADADKWCKENNAVWMPSTLTSRPVLKMKLE